MAIRNIRYEGEPCLRKVCKVVNSLNLRTKILIEDMLDTMYEAGGVGLAAPQVGILKRIAVIDVSEDASEPIIMINPVVVETAGEQTGMEGCLSVPGKQGRVTRANYVKVRCLNEKMEETIIEGEELLARALLHEIEHLDGKLYIDRVDGQLEDVEYEEE